MFLRKFPKKKTNKKVTLRLCENKFTEKIGAKEKGEKKGDGKKKRRKGKKEKKKGGAKCNNPD